MDFKASALPASLALVGALVGFFLATNGRCDHTREFGSAAALAPSQTASDLAPLLEEIRALGDRIVSLQRTQAPTPSPAEPSARTVIPGESDPAQVEQTADLLQVLDRCTALLERIERRSVTGSRPDLSIAPSNASRELLKRYGEEEGADEHQFTKDHLMWSYQQVLERYGKPDHYYSKGDRLIGWMYDQGKGSRWKFTFLDGFVTSCDM